MKMFPYHAITDIYELIPKKEERKGGDGGRPFNQHTLKALPGSQLIHIP